MHKTCIIVFVSARKERVIRHTVLSVFGKFTHSLYSVRTLSGRSGLVIARFSAAREPPRSNQHGI